MMIQAATTMPSVIILLIKSFFFAVLFMGITYTFSFSFLPRIPVGRTKRTMIRTENTIASESWEEIYAFDRISMIPEKDSTDHAPGMEPIPPNTAATKALMPGMDPV